MQKETGVATDEQTVNGRSGNPPGQGRFMHLTLRIVNGIVSEATFDTHPCPGCVACGKAICELVAAKTVEYAKGVKHNDVVAKVGPLEHHRQVCYSLAALALHDALSKLQATH